MKPKSINIYIDKLVLEGVGDLNHSKISSALQLELKRLMASHGLHSSLHKSGIIEQLNAEPLSLSGRLKERILGNKIAGNVYRGMKI